MTKRSGTSLKLVGSNLSAPTGTDRRRSRRSSVIWAATAIVNDSEKLDCVVLNISARGAKIRLATMTELPEAFILHFAKFGPVDVRRLSHNGREVRVVFAHDAAKSKAIFGDILPLD